MKNQMFARAIATFAVIAALLHSPEQEPLIASGYRSRGKGEGLPGNKRTKSSFKQNKRRGL